MGMALLVVAAATSAAGGAGALPCSAAVMARLTAPRNEQEAEFRLTCSVRLKPGESIPRQLLLEGAAASGATIDCSGGTIGYIPPKGTGTVRALLIRSVRRGSASDLRWSRPADIRIRNCTLIGGLFTRGVDPGPRYEEEARLSRRADWTEVAQRAGPTRISVVDSRIHARGVIPVYLGPGTTAFTLARTRIRGKASLAIYMDQESARNRIENNEIDLASTRRELIAVDGSAHNIIRANRLVLRTGDGVWLYRNCGERGVIRHQTPSYNRITGNIFVHPAGTRHKPIVENGRTRRKYCSLDDGYPFGSSVDDRDGGHDNILSDNRIVKE